MAEEYPLPRGLADKVNPHLEKTVGVILANREPCLGMVKSEAAGGRVMGRKFVSFPLHGLGDWTPPKSWVLGFLLCPGDDAQPILDWVKGHGIREPDRIRFYLHRNADEREAMRPWTDAGFSYRLRVVDSWETLHLHFGRQHAFWVLRDHVPDSTFVG